MLLVHAHWGMTIQKHGIPWWLLPPTTVFHSPHNSEYCPTDKDRLSNNNWRSHSRRDLNISTSVMSSSSKREMAVCFILFLTKVDLKSLSMTVAQADHRQYEVVVPEQGTPRNTWTTVNTRLLCQSKEHRGTPGDHRQYEVVVPDQGTPRNSWRSRGPCLLRISLYASARVNTSGKWKLEIGNPPSASVMQVYNEILWSDGERDN